MALSPTLTSAWLVEFVLFCLHVEVPALPHEKCMCLFVLCLMSQKKRWKSPHAVVFFSSLLPLFFFLFILWFSRGATLQFCTSKQRRPNASAWLVELISHLKYQHAHTSRYTNTDIFFSSASSLCWGSRFCLMETVCLVLNVPEKRVTRNKWLDCTGSFSFPGPPGYLDYHANAHTCDMQGEALKYAVRTLLQAHTHG